MTTTEMFRPNFDRYFTGDWNFYAYEGVGLLLTGAPTDEIEFIDLLHSFGCPPTATRRILEDLIANKSRPTTVRSHLDFNELGDGFAEIGVTMQIVAPIDEPANTAYDMAAFRLLKGNQNALIGLTDAEAAHVRALHAVAAASLERLPHNFGLF